MINTLHTQHASNNSALDQFHWLAKSWSTLDKPLKGKPAKTSPFTCNILLRKQLTNLPIWRFYQSFPPSFLRQNISQSLPSCSFSSYSCNPYQHENDVTLSALSAERLLIQMSFNHNLAPIPGLLLPILNFSL